MHPGICPEYRNSHGCFWALANDDPERVGVTLLQIDKVSIRGRSTDITAIAMTSGRSRTSGSRTAPFSTIWRGSNRSCSRSRQGPRFRST